jgi:hypothetical protein
VCVAPGRTGLTGIWCCRSTLNGTEASLVASPSPPLVLTTAGKGEAMCRRPSRSPSGTGRPRGVAHTHGRRGEDSDPAQAGTGHHGVLLQSSTPRPVWLPRPLATDTGVIDRLHRVTFRPGSHAQCYTHDGAECSGSRTASGPVHRVMM